MLDPEEQARNGFRAAADRHAERRDTAGPAASPVAATAGAPHAETDLAGFRVPLVEVLERLADNRRHAAHRGPRGARHRLMAAERV